MKRIISLIMVLVLALSLVPTTVWATEGTPAADVASVTDGSGETQKFASLQEAFEYVAALDVKEPTVTLLTDTTEDVTISANVTFDLGGKVLTGTGKGDTATLTVAKDAVAAVKNGSVKGTANGYYNIQNNGTATLEDVTATAGNNGSSMIDNWGDLTITSGEYSGGLNVVKSEEDSVLKINGGTFTLNYAVSDNYTAVILVYGDTTITDGTFVQTATTPKWSNPQVVMTGLVEGHTAITRITGGTFINKKSGANIFHGLGKATSDNFEVSGGTFNKSISAGYCADGYIPTGKNADGTYGVKQGSYAVKIGSTGYETFADAYRHASTKKTTTITLLKDITESVSINKNITIDLSNFKLTYTNMDTPLVKSGKTLTITNGTLNITGGICEGKLETGKNGKIVVTGGTFAVDPTEFVDTGKYTVTEENGKFTVNEREYVAQVGENKYYTLNDAVAAVADKGTVTLLKDVTLDDSVTINASKEVTIDGQGNTINVSDGKYIKASENGKLTLNGVTVTGPAYGMSLLYITESAEVTISKDSKVAATSVPQGYPAILIQSNKGSITTYTPQLHVYGAVSAVKMPAIQGNGTDRSTSKIDINDGASVTSDSLAMYLPQPCEVNVNGGTVKGYCAIGIKSGTLNINGGLVQGVANDTVISDKHSTTNGINYDGSAIMIDSYIGYAGQVKINISGGKVESLHSTAIREIGNDASKTNMVSLSVTGGEVMGADGMDAILVRDVTMKAGTLSATGGTFSSNPTDYVHDEHYKVSKGLDGMYTVGLKDKDDGTGGKTSVVELPAETTKNTTTATIDVADIDANKELSVVGGDVSVTFDQNAAAGIADAAGNSTELNLTVEKTEPSAEQEKTYDDKLVNTTNEVVVNVTLTADGKPVFDAAKAGGKATVQVPYQVGLKKADISVYYLNNGKTEKVPFTYDAETGIITMTLEHFSAYLITTATHPSITPVDSKPTYIKGSNKDLGFTTVDLPEKITVKVGDKTLTEGKDYTVSDGKLTLTGAYLETLDYGNYTLKVFDENGNEIAKTSFAKSFAARPAQQPAQSGNKNSTSTKDDVKSAGTGDMGVALYAVSAVLSLTGSAWIVGKKRSK